MLEALAQLLQDTGLGVQGENIFVHMMPSSVSQGILLLSPLSGVPIDHELPGYRKTSFQAIVRHTSHASGKALAEQMSNALSLVNTTLSGYDVKFILPRHEPVVFPVSEGDFLEISVNFEAVYVNLS